MRTLESAAAVPCCIVVADGLRNAVLIDKIVCTCPSACALKIVRVALVGIAVVGGIVHNVYLIELPPRPG